jgi:hypothetical protein
MVPTVSANAVSADFRPRHQGRAVAVVDGLRHTIPSGRLKAILRVTRLFGAEWASGGKLIDYVDAIKVALEGALTEPVLQPIRPAFDGDSR